MTNHWSGYHSWVAADSLSPQSSYLAVSGACSIGEFRNGDGQGVISLQLIADWKKTSASFIPQTQAINNSNVFDFCWTMPKQTLDSWRQKKIKVKSYVDLQWHTGKMKIKFSSHVATFYIIKQKKISVSNASRPIG